MSEQLFREGPRIDRCKWCGASMVPVEPDYYIEESMGDVLAGPWTKQVDPDKPRQHDWDGRMLRRWAVYLVEVNDE